MTKREKLKMGQCLEIKKFKKSRSIKAKKTQFKVQKRLNFNLVERRRRRSLLSLLTLSYNLTKLRENSMQISIIHCLFKNQIFLEVKTAKMFQVEELGTLIWNC